MKFKLIALASLLGVLLSACESMAPATYAPFADNSVALRKYSSAKVSVATMNDQSKFDAGCRLLGPVETSGKRSVPQFVFDSFNDELKFGNIYSADQDAAHLEMTLVSASFSSSSNLFSGWWDFTVKLENHANGQTLLVRSKYDFQSGFSAEAACANVSQALTPAVQRLINKTITDPGFTALIGRS